MFTPLSSYFHLHYIIITIFILLQLLFILPSHHAQDYQSFYTNCYKNFSCGESVREIGYPFWGGDRPSYCGLPGLKLSCRDGKYPVLDTGLDYTFQVVAIDQTSHEINMRREDLQVDTCPSKIYDTTLNKAIFDYGTQTEDLHMFYNCSTGTKIPSENPTSRDNLTCKSSDSGTRNVVFFGNESFPVNHLEALKSCNFRIIVEVNKRVLEDFKKNVTKEVHELLNPSFVVYYKINDIACDICKSWGGLCWSGIGAKVLTCLCRDGGYDYPCPNIPVAVLTGKHQNLGLKFAVASGVVGCSILLLVVLIICRRRMRTKYSSSYHKDIETFISQYGSSIPRRFRYSMLKKITNSFKDELGKGGFGNVYRGHLADGHVVAVKVLKETKGNGEEFINEVASIGRTSHVNVVTLLGFCYDDKRRALIYEFMPNGSLEKFIYGKSPSLEGQHLGWEKLYSIAIGIARGLEYLHRGCNTRILHFDIKPHNILLDENFRPKISDFGLAKLYSTDESIISSLLQARGTIGYIAPEVASRNFGQVSHKSDVYSYGMMILEMVGGRKNVNADADHTSEIYYPRWLYKRIQSDDVLNLANEISSEKNEIVRKMVIVGLWCIQIYPSQRPAISKVIEMLEGQTTALEIPPHPYLCSVPSSPSDSKKKLVFSSSSGTEPTSSS